MNFHDIVDTIAATATDGEAGFAAHTRGEPPMAQSTPPRKIW
jgi:hypothetical protein